MFTGQSGWYFTFAIANSCSIPLLSNTKIERPHSVILSFCLETPPISALQGEIAVNSFLLLNRSTCEPLSSKIGMRASSLWGAKSACCALWVVKVSVPSSFSRVATPTPDLGGLVLGARLPFGLPFAKVFFASGHSCQECVAGSGQFGIGHVAFLRGIFSKLRGPRPVRHCVSQVPGGPRWPCRVLSQCGHRSNCQQSVALCLPAPQEQSSNVLHSLRSSSRSRG